MATEQPSLSRPEVAELLGIAPLAVRALECDPGAGFPRGIPQGHPFALRWRRAEVLAFAAGQSRAADTKP